MSEKRIDKEWAVLTEVVKRGLVRSKGFISETAYQFIDKPVSQVLAKEFIASVAEVDPETNRKLAKYSQIANYLGMPTVPEDTLECGLRYAVIQGDITVEVAQRVAKLYKFAGDTKILALGAEIKLTDEVYPDKSGRLVLPSGTEIVLNNDSIHFHEDFFQLKNWGRRRQVTSRTFKIDINAKRYIQKERYPFRDVSFGETLTSEREFQVAKEFHEHGQVSTEHVDLRWEKPIGFVQFPDGHSFTIFQHEDNLLSSAEAMDHLKTALEVQRKQSSEIFELEINYNDQEQVKKIYCEGYNLRSMSYLALGYDCGDDPDCLYRVHTEPRLRFECIGFDLEYFKKLSQKRHAELLGWYRINRPEVTKYEPLFDLSNAEYLIKRGWFRRLFRLPK